MAIEVYVGDSQQIAFTDTKLVPTLYLQTESTPLDAVSLNDKCSDARSADRTWVFNMNLLNQLVNGHTAILGLSDGFTSHFVVAAGVGKGEDNYFIIYVDPWPLGSGSFLEYGKNVAGCSALPFEDRPGHWIIKADELFRVLDDAVVTLGKADSFA